MDLQKKKVSVLFDAGPMIDQHKTGVGYYTENIINAIAQNYGSDIKLEGYYYNFLGRRKQQHNYPSTISFQEIRFFPSKLLSLLRRINTQPPLRLLTPGHYDHVMYTNYVALPTDKTTAVTLFVYDLSFMDCPEYLQEANLKFLKRFCAQSIRQADTIVTISEFTKERILHHFPDIKAEIVVTAIPPANIHNDTSELPQRLLDLGIHKKKYFLYLGTLEPRKNIISLIRAYEQLPQEARAEYSLVLAGGKGWKDTEIVTAITSAQEKGLSVIQTGYVSDQEKSALYSQATCFVMPSHYEGFGMPVLEAMSYGTPVALSDIPVFHEVARDGAVYFDKDNAADIAKKLMDIATNPQLQARLTQRSDEILEEFDSWSENADKIINAMKIVQ